MDKKLSEVSLSSDFEGIDLSGKKGKRNAVEREMVKEIISAGGAEVFDFSKAQKKKKKDKDEEDVA